MYRPPDKQQGSLLLYSSEPLCTDHRTNSKEVYCFSPASHYVQTTGQTARKSTALVQRATMYRPPDKQQGSLLLYSSEPLCTDHRTNSKEVYCFSPASHYVQTTGQTARKSTALVQRATMYRPPDKQQGSLLL